jgi:predicted transcriptional regulator
VPARVPGKPDLYVVARFLDRLAQPGASYTRSKLQLAVRLNYDLFRWYLAFLEAKGFVEVAPEDGRDVVRLTAAGRAADRELGDWVRRLLRDATP